MTNIIEELQSEQELLVQSINALKSEQELLVQSIETTRAKKENAECEANNEIEAIHATLTSQKEAHNTEVAYLASRLTAIRADYDKSIQTLSDTYNAMSVKNKDLEADIERKKEEEVSLTSKIKKLTNEVDILQSSIGRVDETITSKQDDIKKLDAIIGEKEAQHKDILAIIAVANENLSLVKTEYDQVQSKLLESVEQVALLNNQLLELSNIEHDIVSLNETKQSLIDEIATLKNTSSELQGERSAFEGKVFALQERIAKFRASQDTIRAYYERAGIEYTQIDF